MTIQVTAMPRLTKGFYVSISMMTSLRSYVRFLECLNSIFPETGWETLPTYNYSIVTHPSEFLYHSYEFFLGQKQQYDLSFPEFLEALKLLNPLYVEGFCPSKVPLTIEIDVCDVYKVILFQGNPISISKLKDGVLYEFPRDFCSENLSIFDEFSEIPDSFDDVPF